MNTFKFHRDLDIPFLQKNYGEDLFEARSIFGSFIEQFDHEYDLLTYSLEQGKFKVFSRVIGRLDRGLDLLGLRGEREQINGIRSRVALGANGQELRKSAQEVMDRLQQKVGLFKIEVDRLERHLEHQLLGFSSRSS